MKSNSQVSRVILSKDWDVAISPPTEGMVGQFHGRTDLVERLENELRRRWQGSILVCGHRGAGKTAAVYRALHKLREHKSEADSHDHVCFALINASQSSGDLTAKAGEGSRALLNLLITRLYTATREDRSLSKNTVEKIAKLYLKASSSSYSKKNLSENLGEEEGRAENETSVDLELKPKNLSGALISGGLFLVSTIFGIPEHPLLAKVASILCGFGMAISVGFGQRVRLSKSVKRIAKESSAEAYAMDASISSLEFDLEEIHRDLNKTKVKVIYVIDELDKIQEDAAEKVIQYSKNLFSLAGATFIFVSSEEFFERVTKVPQDRQKTYRDASGTLFSSIFYVQRPSRGEMHGYLDAITQLEGVDESQKTLFWDALIFDASGDYFELVHRLRDRIEGFLDQKPWIGVDLDGSDDVVRGRFQKALSVVFESKHRYRQWRDFRKNEYVFRKLNDVSEKIFRVGETVTIQPAGDKALGSEAVRDYCQFLLRCGLINRSSENSFHRSSDRGLDVPDKVNFRTEVEKDYESAFANLAECALKFANLSRAIQSKPALAQKDWLVVEKEFQKEVRRVCPTLDNPWQQGLDRYSQIVGSGILENSSREQVEPALRKLEAAIEQLKPEVPNIVGRLLASPAGGYDFVSYNIGSYQTHQFFGGELAPLRPRLTGPHFILSDSRLKRLLIVVGEGAEMTLAGLESALKNNDKVRVIVGVLGKSQKIKTWAQKVDLDKEPERILEQLEELRQWIAGTPKA